MASITIQHNGDLYPDGALHALQQPETAIKQRCASASMLTIAEFVEYFFVPEFVAIKKSSGRAHFQAILKHVLRPEDVDRVFEIEAKKSRAKLKAVPDWPYLGNVRLRDAMPNDVQQLISAALKRGYSTQTAVHIRNVVSAIFEHARKTRRFTGDNPARSVALPAMTRKEASSLTLAQAQGVLKLMKYPEKELTLFVILTGMYVAEICGLQWKQVNLKEHWCRTGDQTIPPRSIAITKQWYRGELGNLSRDSRKRNLAIPDSLLPVLLDLSRRQKFTGPDDFVLVSQTGSPVSGADIAARRLKPIGQDLQMPWLSWHVLQRTHTNLTYDLGRQTLSAL